MDYTTLPPCQQEDSIDCYWDATVQGNGIGNSFYNLNGTVHYIDVVAEPTPEPEPTTEPTPVEPAPAPAPIEPVITEPAPAPAPAPAPEPITTEPAPLETVTSTETTTEPAQLALTGADDIAPWFPASALIVLVIGITLIIRSRRTPKN